MANLIFGSEQQDRALVGNGNTFTMKDVSADRFYDNSLLNSSNKDKGFVVYQSRFPEPLEESLEGIGVELSNSKNCFAIQIIGSCSGTNQAITGVIQECDTVGGAYTDIPGANFLRVTQSNNFQIIYFKANKKYVRIYNDVAGISPVFLISVLIGEYL